MSMENKRTLVVLGGRGVGKSSIIDRFCYDRFSDSYVPSVLATEHVTLKIDNKQYQCDILDPAGQDEYSTLGPTLTIGVHGYLILFSVRERGSFEMLRGLSSNLLVALGGQKVPTVLVGNQCDCSNDERQVKKEEARKLSNDLKVGYLECSAKSGEGVKEVFVNLLREVNRNLSQEDGDDGFRCVIA